MTITWLGHACFALESGGYRVVIDPYREVNGLRDTDTQANAVFCSHDHYDHNHIQGVRVANASFCPFTVRTVDTFHDDQGGTLRGTNKVHIFSAEGLTVAHLGDLGHLLTAEQAAAIGPCDALLLPVGGTYTVDAAGARAVAEHLQPRVVIPMHYRDGQRDFPVLGTVGAFTALFPADLVRRYDSNTLELTADTPRQIAILSQLD